MELSWVSWDKAVRESLQKTIEVMPVAMWSRLPLNSKKLPVLFSNSWSDMCNKIVVVYGYFGKWIPSTVQLAKGILLLTSSAKVLGVCTSDHRQSSLHKKK